MNHPRPSTHTTPLAASWLKTYYLLRAAVSTAWVLAAFSIGKASPPIGMALLVLYPAWDAAANWLDASQSGGLRRNAPQRLNVLASGAVTVAIAVALGIGMHAVLGVFGVWAGLAGFLQLATGIRRWKGHGAQWPMILSGAQSALAGALFVRQAAAPAEPGVTDIAPYAAVGALYFLISGLSLAVSDLRRGRAVA